MTEVQRLGDPDGRTQSVGQPPGVVSIEAAAKASVPGIVEERSGSLALSHPAAAQVDVRLPVQVAHGLARHQFDAFIDQAALDILRA